MKDMERWAKEQANKKKETLSKKPSAANSQPPAAQTVQTTVEIKPSSGFNQVMAPIIKPKEEEIAKQTTIIVQQDSSLVNKKVLMNIMPLVNNNTLDIIIMRLKIVIE